MGKIKYKLQIKAIVKHENTLKENIGKLYSIIVGQCIELKKSKLSRPLVRL